MNILRVASHKDVETGGEAPSKRNMFLIGIYLLTLR